VTEQVEFARRAIAVDAEPADVTSAPRMTGLARLHVSVLYVTGEEDHRHAQRGYGSYGGTASAPFSGGLRPEVRWSSVVPVGDRARVCGFTSLVALTCLGCTRTIHIQQPLSSNDIQSVNAAVWGQDADVTLRTDSRDQTTTGPGSGLSIAATNVMWRANVVKTSTLLRVHTINHGAGAAEGLTIGALSGVCIGGFLAAAISNNSGGPDESTISPGAAALLGALLFLIPSALIGAGIGTVVGDHTTFVFDESPAPH